MEFLSAFKVIISKNIVDLERVDCDKEILKAYSNFLETENDNIQFQEYKNIISQKCANVSLVYEMYKSYLECYQNNDTKHFSGIIKTIERLADELENAQISCFSYAYFMYVVLSFLGDQDDNVRRLGIEEIKWINPDNYDYSYTEAVASDEQTFGFGRFKESLKDFEFNKDCLVKYNGKNTYVIIPYFVRTIKKEAFKNNKNIRLVHIPKNVKYIEDGAFEGCSNLETVNLSPVVYELPSRAFSGCTLLKRINCENIKSIGHECFYKCIKLEKVKFKSLAVVGNSSFEDCVSITDFAFISNLINIGDRAFAHCQMQGVTLVSCEMLGADAFYQCHKLNMISLDGPLSDIGETPFKGCLEINLLTIRTDLSIRPHLLFENDVDTFNSSYQKLEIINISSIFDEEFKGYSNLLNVTVFDSEVIPLSCFEDCESLSRVVFDKEVLHISERAFLNCCNLKSLKLTFVGESIGIRSFYGCSAINDFSFLNNVAIFEDFSLSRTNLTSFNFNREYKKIGCFAFANSIFNEKINLTLSGCKVYPGAFHGVKKIRRLEISSLENIVPNSKLHTIFEKTIELFAQLVSIDYLIIKDSLQDGSFSGYSNIRYIECNSSDNRISLAAFSGCTSLESIKIYGNIDCIEEKAFFGCNKLSVLDFECTTLSIGDSAFEGCGIVENLIDFNKVVRVGKRAFANTKIIKANFGHELQSIAKGVFCNCFELKEIVLPSCDLLVVDGEYQGINYLFLDNDDKFYITDTFGVDSLTILSEQLPTYVLQDVDYVRDLILPNLIVMDNLSLTDSMNIKRIYYGAKLETFSARSFINLSDDIQLDISEDCKELKSINNSIFSKDGKELFYLSKNDSFESYSSTLKKIKSYAISKLQEDIVLNKHIQIENSAINVSSINHLTIENGAEFDNESFVGLRNIQELSVDTWELKYNRLFNGVLIEKANVTSFDASINGIVLNKLIVHKAKLNKCAFNDLSIQYLEISNVEYIDAEAFAGAHIEKLVLRNIKEIKPLAFAGSDIADIKVEDSAGYILRDGCLYNASALIYCFDKTIERFSCPKGIQRIYGSSFESCNKLEFFESIHSNLFIDDTAFNGCNNLSEIKIVPLKNNTVLRVFGPSKLKKIEFYGDRVPRKYFSNQKNLETVVLHNTIELADLAFANCDKMHTVIGIEKILTFGDLAFYNCASIKELTINSECNRIGISCFLRCDALMNVNKPITCFETQNNISYKDVFGESGKKVTITQGNIPDEYFSGAHWLDEINLTSKTIKIGNKAFSGCACITELVIPDTVQNVGTTVLEGCLGLTKLTLPYVGANKDSIQPLSCLFGENDTSKLQEIKITSTNELVSRMFEKAPVLEVITFNENVVNIPDECFYNLNRLRKITGIEKVAEIGARAFYGCAKIQALNLSTLNKLGENAFYKCSSLEDLTISFVGPEVSISKTIDYLIDRESSVLKNLTINSGSLVKNSFKNYKSLESIYVKFNVEIIPESSFEGLSQLKELNLGGRAKVVESRAFKNCNLIQNFAFNEVVDIGVESFYNTDIQELVLTKKCLNIGTGAFAGCKNISRLAVSLKGQNYLAEIGVSTKGIKDFTLLSGELYTNIFNACENLERVDITPECKVIPDKAFSMCVKLQNVDAKNIEQLGVEAFAGCKALRTINLSKVLHIGQAAFKDSGIKDIVLNDALKIVPDYAFSGCVSLTNINIPKTLLELGGYAFEKTTMKNQVFIMPASLKKVGSYVFNNADSPVIQLRKTQEASWSSFWGKSCKGHGLFWANHNVKVKYIKE